MANLHAIDIVRQLTDEGRQATKEEQGVLARWSSWGAVPEIFDKREGKDDRWRTERAMLEERLTGSEYDAARRTTINAHYTDPAYVEQIWTMLRTLGFAGGRVLEPGSGSGTFIGMAPDSAAMTGVELDPTTAMISQALYPQADIRAESFAQTAIPAQYFDAVVGNVPFADVNLHDPSHNLQNHSIHNHFIIKSLALTRPGGLVAVLTSRYTMDARNPTARREMNSMGDLIGAIRLPTGAHRLTARTDVVTDLLVFRRREPGTEKASDVWEAVQPIQIGESTTHINAFFDEYPEQVLGRLEVGHGMYGSETMQVVADDPDAIPARLSEAIGRLTARAIDHNHLFTARSVDEAEVEQIALVPSGERFFDGDLTARQDGTFTVVQDGVFEPLDVPKSHKVELRALLGIRDSARGLLEAEAATLDDTPEIDELRKTLRDRYGAYVAKYGPLNRFTTRNTGRVDPETGEPRQARITPRVMTTLKKDSFGPLVFGLESYDETTEIATPAPLMTQRVVVPRQPVMGAETPEDALTATLEAVGHPDLNEMARLLGQTPEQTRNDLGTLVFDLPDGGLATSADYLSGDVVAKIDQAREASQDDERFLVNVQMLANVQPSPVGAGEVEARLGAAWIDADTHRQFLAEILDDAHVVVEHPGGAIWTVAGNNHSIAATSEWGTDRAHALFLAQKAMEQRPVKVTDDIGDGKRVANPEATAAATEKISLLQERFGEWVWEDPERATRLLDVYNRRFNNLVRRDYEHEGTRLTLPGLAKNFTPMPHQRAAVARMLCEPATGLFHQVGAGKTAEMVMGTQELKRLGLVSKPVVVVPNHMLEQFTREWLQLYPQARILAAASADLRGENRRQFVARAAMHSWDAILLTQTAFERIPVSREGQDTYARKEIDQIRHMLANSQESGGLSVKRLEKAIATQEEQLAKILDGPEDRGLTFEDTGIDYVVVDEMHHYKNLHNPTSISDAFKEGSKRATDLHMKLELLRGRHGDHVVTGATATPIANSMSEAFIMMKYLRPDLLENAGVDNFDAWAATFGQTVTEFEMSPSGDGSFTQRSRFAKFQNVPEMLRMWHTFADVRTAEDLNLPTPDLRANAAGERIAQVVIVPPTEQVVAYALQLADRAEAVRDRRVDPADDNMLKISNDGRKAALDMRLIDGQTPIGETKIDAATNNIVREWDRHRDTIYTDTITGEESPTPGGLQIVFCDLGTPNEKWNVYDQLRAQLVDRGVPRDQIRFMHEAKTDADKARLFAAARAGHVAVLVGSTQKMGVGTNVQARATALHHLDCPWRPADIEQREGRIMRQGNQNEEVSVYRYVVERSFDGVLWGTVERKAKFISSVMSGRTDLREIEDVGDSALSFAQVKAAATGNPLVLEKAEADAERTRLERLNRAHSRNHTILGRTITQATGEAEVAGNQIPQIQDAIDRSVDTSGDQFDMTVQGQRFGSRADAATAIRRWAGAHSHEFGTTSLGKQHGTLVDVGGHEVQLLTLPGTLGSAPFAVLSLRDVPRTNMNVSVDKLHEDGIGLVRQIENRIASLPTLGANVEQARTTALRKAEQAREEQTKPFKYTTELDAARTRVINIDAAIRDSAQPAKAEEHAELIPTESPAQTRENQLRDKYRSLQERVKVRPDPRRTAGRDTDPQESPQHPDKERGHSR